MQRTYFQLQTGESRWTVVIGEAACTRAQVEGKKALFYKGVWVKAEIDFKV